MAVSRIDIKKHVSFEELENRLRNVSLRGFPDVKIYRKADIQLVSLTPEQIQQGIYTPQPSVYTPQLNQVNAVAELFAQQGVDIFRMKGGIDYEAHDENGVITEWTMLPPVVEVLPFRFNSEGRLDYSKAVGEELKAVMEEKGYRLNPEVQELSYPEYDRFTNGIVGLSEICDGSHRIEVGIRRGESQNLLVITGVEYGFPYYAVPKPYSIVHEEPERVEEKLDKTHVLTSPGHKLLYRLFPSGGINSGNVRPTKEHFD